MMQVNKSLAIESEGPMPMSPGMTDSPESYPTIHYSGDEEIKIPAHGNMLVHYCVTRVVQTTTKTGTHYECDIQIKKVISAEEEMAPPSKKYDDAGDALDKLARERMEENEDEEGEY